MFRKLIASACLSFICVGIANADNDSTNFDNLTPEKQQQIKYDMNELVQNFIANKETAKAQFLAQLNNKVQAFYDYKQFANGDCSSQIALAKNASDQAIHAIYDFGVANKNNAAVDAAEGSLLVAASTLATTTMAINNHNSCNSSTQQVLQYTSMGVRALIMTLNFLK